MTPTVRAAVKDDLVAIQAIYAHHVLHGTGTFEEVPPDLAEMAARFAAVARRDLPWRVAEIDGQVVGYAYAAPFRARSAYRFTVEDSVYVAPDAQRMGVGGRLLSDLVAECEARGLKRLLAVIGDAENGGSIALHQRCGFSHQGVLTGVGLKFGRWLDVVLMERRLNVTNSAPQ
jgi:L-amino acid N-acyltransferase YncA